jgi:AcrR family transcriptional regulator
MDATEELLECQLQFFEMTSSRGRPTHAITPNRRGVRAREAVLDAAERLIAQHGYDAATIAALVAEAGVPSSSIYHYFGSKQGVLLAAVERGAERFFHELPAVGRRSGSEREHVQALLDTVQAVLRRHPDFPCIVVALATQPPGPGRDEFNRVVGDVRELALQRLRREMHVAFGLDPAGAGADGLARFALAAFVGAVVADGSRSARAPADVLAHLPAALVAARRQMGPAGVADALT